LIRAIRQFEPNGQRGLDREEGVMSRPEVSTFHVSAANWDANGVGVAAPALENGAVHVWALGDELNEAARATVVDWLTHDERRRAGAYRRDGDRNSFIVRRGVLRCLIGRYCRCPPQSVAIAVLEFGKPVLAGHAPLAFSVSRRQGMTLFAFTREATIGVDVECLADGIDVSEIAPYVLSATEMAALLNCEPSDRATFFNATLVRKEALLKAVGTGLSGDVLAYSTVGGVVRYQGAILRNWCLFDIDIGQRWRAALAVGSKD
jgi:4'-phosphopantetheinyl transferase